MNPAQKALWFIESHLADALTLDEIAGVGGISRFHMVRAFGAATGLSVMRYVRARRLSEAARALANGAPGILTLALDADYGSHEAFNPHRQSSSPAFSDRQAVARRRYWRALHLRD
jgi:AraC family transcriptional regulator